MGDGSCCRWRVFARVLPADQPPTAAEHESTERRRKDNRRPRVVRANRLVKGLQPVHRYGP
jgi:hypothetical protein